MDGWMQGWADGWMDGWMDGRSTDTLRIIDDLQVPYVQMPPPTLSTRDAHVAWVRNECDDADHPCDRRWVWTDQRPHRPLVTTEFPVGEYVPTRRYPYIRGPFKHYMVTPRGNIDQHGDKGGHWVFVKDTDSNTDGE
jgi:hypothetical protein